MSWIELAHRNAQALQGLAALVVMIVAVGMVVIPAVLVMVVIAVVVFLRTHDASLIEPIRFAGPCGSCAA